MNSIVARFKALEEKLAKAEAALDEGFTDISFDGVKYDRDDSDNSVYNCYMDEVGSWDGEKIIFRNSWWGEIKHSEEKIRQAVVWGRPCDNLRSREKANAWQLRIGRTHESMHRSPFFRRVA